MSDDGKVSPKSMELAVELTKAVLPMQSGSLVSQPELVTTFIEKVAKKIDSLSR